MALRTALRTMAWGLLFFAIPLAAYGGDFTVAMAETPPTLDGKINDAEWKTAVQIDGFGKDRRRARAYVTATPTHLYLAVRSQLPAEGDLMAAVEKNTAKMVFDDSIEIWIDPDAAAGDGRRYQLMTNSLGFRWSKMHPRGAVEAVTNFSADWKTANGMHDGWWHCEMAIAVDSLAKGRTADAGEWEIDIWRNWKQPWTQAFLGKAAYRFVKEPVPTVRLENRGLRHEGKVDYALVIDNPTPKPVALTAQLLIDRDAMPSINREETLTLAPNNTKTLQISEDDQNTKKWKLTAKVITADGATTFFTHACNWALTGPWVWKAFEKKIIPVDFLFAYHPSRNRLRILADTSNLPPEATLETLVAVVRKQGGDAVKTIPFENLVDGREEKTVELPELDGTYEIALKATGTKVPQEDRVKTFERHRYEWEGKGYGKTTKVYPPFTPMEVEGRTVRTVLRTHEANDAGLWDQVEAQAQNTGVVKPILAAPMRYTATVGGKAVPVEATGFTVENAAGHEVTAKAGFTAGALSGTAALRWEYDGTMRVDLTLQPTGETTVDALDLEIPLRHAAATHIHAMGDGIRNTVNIRLPAHKRGKLWDATKVERGDLPPGFCSYIYVGTPARGLCWFAANDRGWSWERGTPNLDIVRTKEGTVLRVHLVNTPLAIESPRTITFGLQAAPVKPRLGGDRWRRYRQHKLTLLLTGVNWGSFSAAANHYPVAKDLLIWRKLAKTNLEGGHPRPERLKVVEHYMEHLEPYKDLTWRGNPLTDFHKRHIQANLRANRVGKTMIFYFNRASCLYEDEFRVFQDEWALHDFRPNYDALGKKPHHEIKIVPTESYLDFALHWYAKSFEVAHNRGVYWDNMFFRGSYNTAFTQAYVREDGTIRASTGIWGLRELVKRTFQFMCERGIDPLTMPHITSTNILPVYSFATITYDLEWKYGKRKFQDRFSQDYTLMVTNGELAGAWPLVLGDRGYEEPYFIPRTFTGCLLVHDTYKGQDRAGKAFLRPVKMMLKREACQVHRYWDESPPPVEIEDREVPFIVHWVPGEQALITVANYSRGQRRPMLSVSPERLGFEGDVIVRDYETMRGVGLKDGKARLRLHGHTIRMYEVIPAPAK